MKTDSKKITEIKEFLQKWNLNNEVYMKDRKVIVGGSLYLSGTNITELPDNLTVGGSLDLSGTNITELPDNLTVGGSLALRGTNITELPDNLTVGGWLDLSGTNITEPRNLNKLVKGYCKEKNYIYFDNILWGQS
mgnify:CR=1 FL=1